MWITYGIHMHIHTCVLCTNLHLNITHLKINFFLFHFMMWPFVNAASIKAINSNYFDLLKIWLRICGQGLLYFSLINVSSFKVTVLLIHSQIWGLQHKDFISSFQCIYRRPQALTTAIIQDMLSDVWAISLMEEESSEPQLA